MNLRKCNSCQAELPAEAFHKHPSTKDRLANTCKACVSLRYKRKHGLLGKKAFCQQCGTEIVGFRRNQKYCSDKCRESARRYRCKENPDLGLRRKETAAKAYRKRRDYYVAKQRSYAAEHREQNRLAARRWKAKNPEKVAAQIDRHKSLRAARLADQSDGTAGAIIQKVLSGSRCLYCGARLNSLSDKRLDHMNPVALGGLHSACNFALSCEPCNVAKGAMPFVDWLDTLEEPHRSRALKHYIKLNGAPPHQHSLLMPVQPPPRMKPVKWTEADAKRAWKWWIDEGAPDWWLDGYWSNHPRPWLDKRLSAAEAQAIRYRLDAAHREYHIRGKPSRSPEHRRLQRMRYKQQTEGQQWQLA